MFAVPQAKKPDRLRYAANLAAVGALLCIALTWALRRAAGLTLRLLHAGATLANPVGVPEWVMGLWNVMLAGAGALAAFFFVRALVKGSPLAGRVSLAVPHDGTMWLLLPGFLGVSLVLNMVVSVLQRMLAAGTRYQAPDAVQLPEGRGAMALYFISICVVPAVVEELFVRGALQPMFARWGAWFSILLTSVLFTLMHGDIAQMPAVFLISMVLGITAHASGSLLPGMVMHFANNCMSFCFTWAAQKLDGIGALALTGYLTLVFFLAALLCTSAFLKSRGMSILAALPRWNDAKNRQRRLSRLASSPLFVALMLGLAVRAVLPLWVRQ